MVSGLNYSCQKCELIDQTVTPPPKICKGTFYFNKLESIMDTSFSFNILDKPLAQTLNPIEKAGPFRIPFSPLSMRSNFSAYDSINGIYAFEFFTSSSTTIGFYSNQSVGNISTNSSFLDRSISPTFQNGHLYVINVETFGSDLQYSIGEINPISGQDGVGLIGNTVTINNPAEPLYFSSAAGKSGLVYFLGGTNLIEYNSTNNTTRYFDIDPNPVVYLGLEYDSHQDFLLSIKNADDGSGGFRSTLVSIKITPSGTQLNQVFDIAANLPPGHSTVINTDFHSTTFDPCDTTYYITEINTINPLTTNFMEISLNKQTLINHVVQGYCFGIECVSE